MEDIFKLPKRRVVLGGYIVFVTFGKEHDCGTLCVTKFKQLDVLEAPPQFGWRGTFTTPEYQLVCTMESPILPVEWKRVPPFERLGGPDCVPYGFREMDVIWTSVRTHNDGPFRIGKQMLRVGPELEYHPCERTSIDLTQDEKELSSHIDVVLGIIGVPTRDIDGIRGQILDRIL